MKLTRSKVTGLVCFIIGAVLSFMALGFKPLIELNEPGPYLFPMIGSIGLAICGLGIFFEKEKEEPVFLTKEGWIRVIQLAVPLLLYAACVKFTGFIYPLPFFLFAMIMVLANKEKRPRILTAAVISVIVTILIYAVFTFALKVMLPPGILFE